MSPYKDSKAVFIDSPQSHGDPALFGHFLSAICGHSGMLFLCGRVCPPSRPFGAHGSRKNRGFRQETAGFQRVPYQNEGLNRSQ